jgi:hypothetical protein
MGREDGPVLHAERVGADPADLHRVPPGWFGRNDKITVNAAFLVGVMLATMFRFWSYRKWVWRLAPPGAEPIEPVEPDEAARVGHLNGYSHSHNGQRGQRSRGTDERVTVASGPGRHRAGRG